VEDGHAFAPEGNLRVWSRLADGAFPHSTRLTAMTLLANYTYELTFVSGTSIPSFVPSNVTIQYKDGGACGQGLTLRLRGSSPG